MNVPNSHWCQYCGTPFDSKRYLSQHQARAKSCRKYRDALFCCQRCGIFRTKGIRNFDLHLETCTGVQPENSVQSNILERLRVELSSVRTKLSVEKVRSNIYLALLDSHTTIDIGNIVYREGESVHLFDLKPRTKIFLEERVPTIKLVGNKKQEDSGSRGSSEAQKEQCSYRRAPKQLENNPEPTNKDRTLLIDQIDKRSRETLNQLDEEKTRVITKSCQDLITQLLNSRGYTKLLRNLKTERSKLLGTLGLQEYTQVVQSHIEQLAEVFRNKQQSDKKIKSNILNSLTPVEARLLRYSGYTDTHMDAACRERLEAVVRHGRVFSKEFEPYSVQSLSDRLTTYSIAVFPIEKLIRWALVNSYGFWNVVYLDWPRSSSEDPYSFYVLHKIKKGKRYWNMDCRLEDFTTDLITCIQPYLTKTFRDLYYATFSDNGYRPNAMELSPFAAEDCEQLARNIIMLSQPRKLCGKIRTLLVEECTYKHTCKDNFSLLGDDPLQRKRFQGREKIEMVSTIRQLFDQITDEQAVNFYKSRNTA
jgi:hypothetical protein